jgi:hypothetical protein
MESRVVLRMPEPNRELNVVYWLPTLGCTMEASMKKISTLAAILLFGTAVAAYGQKSPGASENTPADTMKDRSSTLSGKSGPGASEYTPGHEQKTPGGASELSPGDKMNDARSKGGK